MDNEDEASTVNPNSQQNLHDLQNYLSTFNKEIERVDDDLSAIGVDTEVGDVGDLYASSGSNVLHEPGDSAVQFTPSFYSEQGILGHSLTDETEGQLSNMEGGPVHDGEDEDVTAAIKQEVDIIDLDSVQSQLTGFTDDLSQMTANIEGLQNQGLLMTSLGDSLESGGGKVIRIVSLGDCDQFLALGDGSQMQVSAQDLAALDTAPNPDSELVIHETPGSVSDATKMLVSRPILSTHVANPHLALNKTPSSVSATQSLLTPTVHIDTSAVNSGVTTAALTTIGGTAGSAQLVDVSQLLALQSSATLGSSGLQPQLIALPSADGLQQIAMLPTDGEMGYQALAVVPQELGGAEGMNYILVMAPQEAEKPGPATQWINLKQEPENVVEELLEVNGEVKRVLRVVPTKKPITTGATTSGGTMLMCDFCDYTSPKRYLLTRHMKSHSDERPHKCSECHRGFKTPASLMNHVNTHTGTRPHKCKTCDAAFTTSGELVRHIRYRHTFEKPHRCPNCDYASVELSKLKRHMRSHTGERPYKCPHCRYASPDTYKLKRHLRIHTGEKPYECDICHARFTQSNSLKAHKLIHSGNKPVFQCSLCPTTCGRKTDLKIHFNKLHAVGSPLECKKCGQVLADRYSFKQHMRSHDLDKCWPCAQCSFIATSDKSLEQHAAIHANGVKYECPICHVQFNLKQTLDKHSLTCSSNSAALLKGKKGFAPKFSVDMSLFKTEESGAISLSVTANNSSGNTKLDLDQNSNSFPSKITADLSENSELFQASGPLASGTLHQNLLQDIKAGKLGDVPQVVIVHPDGTLEELPSANTDKVNLDDVFSALSNTEKKDGNNQEGQGISKQPNTQQSDAVTGDKDAYLDGEESSQCEASTQAELESDSDSVDETRMSDSSSSGTRDPSKVQEVSTGLKRTGEINLCVDNIPDKSTSANVSKDASNESSSPAENVSKQLQITFSVAPGSQVSPSAPQTQALTTLSSLSPGTLSIPEPNLTSLDKFVDGLNVSVAVMSNTSNSVVSNSFGGGMSNVNGKDSTVTSSAVSSTPHQFVFVKGYTCLNQDGDAAQQPTLVNVALDKDSLVKMFATLGPAGDATSLQSLQAALPGDLASPVTVHTRGSDSRTGDDNNAAGKRKANKEMEDVGDRKADEEMQVETNTPLTKTVDNLSEVGGASKPDRVEAAVVGRSTDIDNELSNTCSDGSLITVKLDTLDGGPVSKLQSDLVDSAKEEIPRPQYVHTLNRTDTDLYKLLVNMHASTSRRKNNTLNTTKTSDTKHLSNNLSSQPTLHISDAHGHSISTSSTKIMPFNTTKTSDTTHLSKGLSSQPTSLHIGDAQKHSISEHAEDVCIIKNNPVDDTSSVESLSNNQEESDNSTEGRIEKRDINLPPMSIFPTPPSSETLVSNTPVMGKRAPISSSSSNCRSAQVDVEKSLVLQKHVVEKTECAESGLEMQGDDAKQSKTQKITLKPPGKHGRGTKRAASSISNSQKTNPLIVTGKRIRKAVVKVSM